MKSKEQVLESYFGSDFYKLKRSNDLPFILKAMEEYAEQFKPVEHKFTCRICGGHEKHWSIKNDDWYCSTCTHLVR